MGIMNNHIKPLLIIVWVDYIFNAQRLKEMDTFPGNKIHNLKNYFTNASKVFYLQIQQQTVYSSKMNKKSSAYQNYMTNHLLST